MKTLVIYDNDGYLISAIKGNDYKIPNGVPYIEEEIPDKKRLRVTNGVCVDVSKVPHQLMLEDIPKTEIEEIRDYVDELEIAMIDLASMFIGNGGEE